MEGGEVVVFLVLFFEFVWVYFDEEIDCVVGEYVGACHFGAHVDGERHGHGRAAELGAVDRAEAERDLGAGRERQGPVVADLHGQGRAAVGLAEHAQGVGFVRCGQVCQAVRVEVVLHVLVEVVE